MNSAVAKLLAACAVTMLCGFNTGWTGPLIPAIAKARALDLTEAGLMVSVSAAGSMVTLLLGKLVVDRWGSGGCLTLSVSLLFLGLAGIALAPNLILIALASFIVGTGSGFNSIGATTAAFDTGGGASAINKVNFFYGVGALAGPLIAWAGLASPWSYHVVYLCGALAAGVILSYLFRLSSTAGRTHERSAGQPILGIPWLWAYALVIFIYVGIETGTAAWLFTYLQRECSLSVGLASICMTTLWGGLTASRMLAIFLTRKFSARRVNFVSMMMAITALALLTFNQHIVVTVILVALLGLGYGPIFPNTVANSNERFAVNSTMASTVVITSGAVGAIFVPILIGYCFKNIGLKPGMEVIAVLALIMFLVYLALGLERRRQPAEPQNG